MKKKRKRKHNKSSSKGSRFERHICGLLSRWWTYGKRDDVFWRTAGSGARATGRAKRGKKTANACGDICHVDAIGSPLTYVFAFELKAGYVTNVLGNIVDRCGLNCQWEDWIRQAENSSDMAQTYSWAVIHLRARRDVMIHLPKVAFKRLAGGKGLPRFKKPYTITHVEVQLIDGVYWEEIISFRLADFLQLVTPGDVKRLAKELQNENE